MITYVLLYEGSPAFEYILPTYLLKTAGEVVTFGLTKDMITCAEGLRLMPHVSIDEIKLTEDDVLIIPGGDAGSLYQYDALYDLIRVADEKGIIIGAICSGVIQLAKAGILNDREYTTSVDVKTEVLFDADMYVNENVVVDEHIVTAKPTGYVDFGIMLGHLNHIYEDEADLEETVKFFREYEY